MTSRSNKIADQDPTITPLMREVGKVEKMGLDHLREMLSDPEHIATLFVKDSKGRTVIDWARLCRNSDAIAAVKAAMLAEINRCRMSNVQIGTDYVTNILSANAKLRDELMSALRTRNVGAVNGVLAQTKLRREEVESLGDSFFTDAKDRSGYTPLILAAGQNLFEIVVLLLDMNVPVDSVNKFGHTAFTFACSGGHASVAVVLLRRGANLHHQTQEGRTGLHYACLYSKVSLIRALVDFYADKIATDRVLTPLEDDERGPRWAADADLVEAFVKIRDIYGLTPYDLVPTKVKNMLLSTEDAGKLTIDKINMARKKRLGYDDESLAGAVSATNRTSSGDAGKEDSGDVAKEWKQFSSATTGSLASNPDASVEDIVASMAMGNEARRKAEVMCDERSGIVHDTCKEDKDMYAGHNIITDADASSMGGGGVSVSDSQQALAKQIEDIFLQVRRRVAHWRSNGRVEDDLMRPMVCPLECGWQGSEEDLRAHVKMDCSHRKIPCKYCRELYPFIRLDNHEKDECELRLVSCPNATKGCSDIVIFNQIKAHLRQKCRVRLAHCRLNCGSKVRYDRMGKHETMECPCRLETCDLCTHEIMFRDMVKHKAQECPDRLVLCSVSCRRLFKAKEVKDHETRDCVHPCKWQCGRIIGPPEALKLHELSQCLLRTYDCRNKCGLGGVVGKFVEDHERYQCPRAMVPCNAGCGKQVPREELPAHCSPWSGACSERWVRCPSNLVGWKVRLFGPTIPATAAAPMTVPPSMQSTSSSSRPNGGGTLTAAVASSSSSSSSSYFPSSTAANEAGAALPPAVDEYGSVGIVLKYERVLRKSDLTPDQRVCISDHFDVSRSTTAMASRQHAGEKLPASPFQYHRRPGTNSGGVFTPGDGMNSRGRQLGEIPVEEGGDDGIYCQLCKTGEDVVISNNSSSTAATFSLQEYNWSLKTPIKTTRATFGGTSTIGDDDLGRGPMVLFAADEKEAEENVLPRPTKKKIPAYDLVLVRLNNCHVWINVWTSDFLLLDKALAAQERGIDGSKSDTKMSGDDGRNYECGWIVYGELNSHLQSLCCNRSVWLRGESDRPAAAPEHVLKATGAGASSSSSSPNASGGTTLQRPPPAIINGGVGQLAITSGSTTSTAAGAIAASAATASTPIKMLQLQMGLPPSTGGLNDATVPGTMANGERVGQHARFRDAVVLAETRDNLDGFLIAPGGKTCDLCANKLEDEDLKHHSTICGSVIIRCKFGCGKSLQRLLMTEHVANECAKRPVICPDCGDGETGELWADELADHLANFCSKRATVCPLECGIKVLTAGALDDHISNHCPRRTVACSNNCGMEMEFSMLHLHVNGDCTMRLHKCTQGCGDLLLETEMSNHCQYLCTLRDQFFARTYKCPLGCGGWIKRSDTLEHVSYYCSRRLCECPFACGISIRFHKLKWHLNYCPNRPICCDRGMKVCEQPIKKWFYKIDEAAAMSARTTARTAKRTGGSSVGATRSSLRTSGMGPAEGSSSSNDNDRQLVVQFSADNNNDNGSGSSKPDDFQGGPVPRFFDGDDRNPATESENIDDDDDDEDDGMKSRAASIHSHRKKRAAAAIAGGGGAAAATFDQLGLKPCERHNFTALVAAVKQDEFLLAEYILKLTAGNDIDSESKMGDTALIIACRMGKLNFVKLLVENGAEVNYETKTGRTALIETTRAGSENIPILEYLLNSGAFAMHRTKTARKTAIDWARQNCRFESLRIMKLSVLVHEQTSIIFRAIGAGDIDKVRKMISAGTPFQAEDEIQSYVDMEKSIADARQAEIDARGIADLIVNELRVNIDESQEHLEHSEINLQLHEEDLKEAMRDQERLGNKITACYATYEQAARSLTAADLEEVYRMRTPDEVTKIAIFCYGLLFGVLDQRKWLRHVDDMDSEEAKWFLDPAHVSEWWPVVTESLVTNGWVLERIVQYPLDRLLDSGKLATSTSSIKLLRTLSRSASRPTELLLPDIDKGDSGLSKLGELMLPYRALLVSGLQQQAAREEDDDEYADDFNDGASTAMNSRPSNKMRTSSSKGSLSSNDNSITASAATAATAATPSQRQSIRDLKHSARTGGGGGVGGSPMASSSVLGGNNKKSVIVPGSAKSKTTDFHSDLYFPRPRGGESEDTEVNISTTVNRQQRKLASTVSVRNTVDVRPLSRKRRKDEFDDGEEPFSDDEEEIVKRKRALPDILQPASIIAKPGIGGVKSTIVPVTEGDKTTAALIAAAEQRALGIAARVASAKRIHRTKKAAIPGDDGGNDDDDNGDGDITDIEVDDAGIPVIPDEDWDSEADEEGVLQGEWIKGKWVPKLRKKARWWEALKRHKSSSVSISVSSHNGDDDDQSSVSSASVVADEIGGIEDSKGRQLLGTRDFAAHHVNSISTEFGELVLGDNGDDNNSGLGSLFSHTRRSDDIVDLNDDLISLYEPPHADKLNRLVYVVLTLMQTGHSLSQQRCRVAAVNQWVLTRSFARDGANRAHEAARSHLEFAKLTLHQTEYKMVEKMREAKKLLNKSVVSRERLRVIRLLNQVSESGHTAASWAACQGAYNILDELMQHGAPVGFNVRLTQLSASYLQMSYRLYVLRTKVRRQKQMEEENPELIIMAKEKGESSEDGIAKIFNLQDERARLLGTLKFYRQRIRFPVPEAAYRAKWEIIHMLQEREYFHYNFINTWIFPSPPVPYVYLKSRHKYKGEKISMHTVMAHGMSDLSAGRFTDGFGWVPPGHPKDDYGEAQEQIAALMVKVDGARNAYIAMRLDVRRRNNERANQESAMREMEAAVKAKDFEKCMKIAMAGNAPIDHEGPDGMTPLMSASEEDATAVDHTYMQNDDGIECLAVAYLLDRGHFRPAVNVENEYGRTALIHACILNRPHVAQALLDRGALINRQNKYGNTALFFAAMSGSAETTRLLLERGGNPRIINNDGVSAFDKAEAMGLVHILKLFSQYNAGFLGDVKVTRGYIVDTVSCPLGCGTQMLPEAIDGHCKICSCREVDCPLGCGQLRLLAREVDEHIANVCSCQPAPCDLCGAIIPTKDRRTHMDDLCSMRLLVCPNGCGEEMKAYLVSRHFAMCTQRFMRCPLCCPKQIRMIEASSHLANECENRRIRCERHCGANIVAKTMSRHLTDVCPFRPVACEFCREKVRYRDYKTHATQCPDKALPCLNKCGEIIRQDDMKDHIANDCALRFMQCPNNCSLKIRHTEIVKHLEVDCANRLIECPLRCFDESLDVSIIPPGEDMTLAAYFVDHTIRKVRKAVLDLHLAHECPNRPIRCGLCTAPLMAYQSERHKVVDCGRRMVPCRNEGCTKQVPFDERGDHERLLCRFRALPCPLGCGEILIHTRSGLHTRQECTNRYINCPLKCGYRTRFIGMQFHLEEECLRRFGVIDKGNKGKSNISKLGGASGGSGAGSVVGGASIEALLGPASRSLSRSQSAAVSPRSVGSRSVAGSTMGSPRSQLTSVSVSMSSATLPISLPSAAASSVTGKLGGHKLKPMNHLSMSSSN